MYKVHSMYIYKRRTDCPTINARLLHTLTKIATATIVTEAESRPQHNAHADAKASSTPHETNPLVLELGAKMFFLHVTGHLGSRVPAGKGEETGLDAVRRPPN